MNLTKSIEFKNFKFKNSKKKIHKLFKKLINENNLILKSLSKSYKNSFKESEISKFKNYSNIIIIGMGGSILVQKQFIVFAKQN